MIVGLSLYTKETIDRIVADNSIHSVILGDPFCNKKMFTYEKYSLIDFARTLRDHGIEIIYQTPKYITDRTFDKEMVFLDYLICELGVKKILVQDIGVIAWLKKRYSHIELIWSIWGKARLNAINEEFVTTIANLGISSVANDMLERKKTYENHGLKVYMIRRGVCYTTLNRECYAKYLSGNFESTCSYECKHGYRLRDSNQFEISVNGYLLNEKYVKNGFANVNKDEIIYAIDYDDYANYLNEENK